MNAANLSEKKHLQNGDDVVGTCDCCGVDITRNEDRWMTLEGKAHEFMEDHKPHCSCIHEIYRYRMDDLPRDEPQTLYRGLENHAPREVFDTFLLGDIIDSYFGDDEVDCDPFQNEDSKQFLEKAFKKRDSIYAKADKQWLRYLMKQCREHGLLDEEDEAA